MLDCFNSIYNHMNMIRMKYVSPTDIPTFSVGSVHCGTAMNIVPDELVFDGTHPHLQRGGGRSQLYEAV